MTSPRSMLNRRQMLGLGAAVGSGLALAGCGSGTPGESAQDAKNTGSTGTATVQFWQTKLTEGEDTWYKQMVDKYNSSQSKVKIVLTQVPGDAWDQKLKAAQAAGKAPDMYIGVGNGVWTMVDNGELADMTDLLPQESWDDLTDTAKSLVTVEGKMYAYPMLFEPQTVLYYRKDYFSAAGLDPNSPPKSWADLLNAGKKTTAKGRFGLIMGVTGGDFGWQSWPWQRNVAGHLPISDDWSKGRADDPKYRKLGQLYRNLYAGNVIPKQSLGAANDSTPFGQGKGAMMIQGSWGITQILDQFASIKDNVGIVPLPTVDGTGVAPATLGNMKWYIDAKSQNKKAAADFFSWALAGKDTSVILDYFKATQYCKFPARKSVADAIAKVPDADTVNPWRKVIADEVVPKAALEPKYDWTVAEAFGNAMEQCMRGTDPAKALTDANNKINAIIKKLDLAANAKKAKS